MKALFFGGTGTISSACTALAQKQGWEVTLLNRGNRPAPEGMKQIIADCGDVDALKEAEPWLFTDAPARQQGGKTGLPNAGTSTDAGKTMKRWRRLAGLDDSNDNA